MSNSKATTIIGGGLAGSEAAYQISKNGFKARLFEMRPKVSTPAHKTSFLGELVCSNSLKSYSTLNASGILKEEIKTLGSIVIEASEKTRLPAGQALAVDRDKFSQYLTNRLEQHPNIEILREEVKEIPNNEDGPVIIATGPLTSNTLFQKIQELTNSQNLNFYDAVSPIIDAETINSSKTFKASRYNRGDEIQVDYVNCPLNEIQYYRFIDEILSAQKVEIRKFERDLYFESCLPIEIIAERGKDTLRYGPMKPVGLTDPETKSIPFAVVQLRKENNISSMFNMVGFQTKLRYPGQKRIFRMIPGLENAEFMIYGSVHRNTFINSPKIIHPTLQLKGNESIILAGQLVGVEGYVESAAMGIIAGINAVRLLKKIKPLVPPKETAVGSLIRYITNENITDFQPMNINFGLFPMLSNGKSKSLRRKLIVERAFSKLYEFKNCILTQFG